MKFYVSVVVAAFAICVFSIPTANAFQGSKLSESADPYFQPGSSTSPARPSRRTTQQSSSSFAPPATAAKPFSAVGKSAPAPSNGAFKPTVPPQPASSTPGQFKPSGQSNPSGQFKPSGQFNPNANTPPLKTPGAFQAKPARPTVQETPHVDDLLAPETTSPAKFGSNSPGSVAPSSSTASAFRATKSGSGNYGSELAKAKQQEQKQELEQKHDRTSYEPSRILARVGDQPIFVSDLSVEAMTIVDQNIRQAPMSIKQREARKLMPRLLPKYIQAKLLLVDALDSLPESANVNDVFETAGEQFEEIMLPRLIESTGVKSSGELDAYYRALGSSLRTVKQSWVESELVKFMMRDKINMKPDVSHREIYDYYQANKSNYAIPAKVKWEQLLVRFDRFPNRQAAQEAIAKMGDEVIFGAPFAAVAKRSSQGFKASSGGLHDWTTKGSLADKKMDELLFAIEPGKLSEIVETPMGYAIVRVIDRSQARHTPFAEKQQEILNKLKDEKLEAEFQKHVANVRNRIPVEVFDTEFLAEAPTATRR